jgi:hypothetical protein
LKEASASDNYKNLLKSIEDRGLKGGVTKNTAVPAFLSLILYE